MSLGFETTELIEYTTASHLAAVYVKETAAIRAAILAIGESCERLQDAFCEPTSRYSFSVSISQCGRTHHCNDDGAAAVLANMKREAWATLVGKLGIERLMSSARREELRKALYNDRGDASELPEITPDTMLNVLAGYVDSAEEFLLESIREEYDFWKPHDPNGYMGSYKTNDVFKIGRKLIRVWMVEPGWGGTSWRPRYQNEPHIISLDRIFHALDGAGLLKEHRGPLVSAIMTAGPDGTGETDYFRFRCCKNGNLHLEFKRLDLVDRFNEMAGRAWLKGGAK